ncbi:MAG: hypothetical protein WCT02_02075 [Candidatus Paceibacterota bacterium]
MTSSTKNIVIPLIVIAVCAVVYVSIRARSSNVASIDPTLKNVTLSGLYVCLPHANKTGPQTEECAFGIQTDDGIYYAVNFGASAGAQEQFQSKVHIKAEGFLVSKEALNTDQWNKYDMNGIFTITKMIEPVNI